MARLSVGLDSLAQRYRRFGTTSHEMQYITATAEYLPIANESFDVASSIMSLKHVIGIHLAIDEIIRVMAPGGSLLIGTRVNNRPNRREPIRITRETFNKLLAQLKPLGGHYTDLDTETTIPLEQWISPDRPADTLHRGALLAHFNKGITNRYRVPQETHQANELATGSQRDGGTCPAAVTQWRWYPGQCCPR